jgi:hypothetical protein
MFVSQLFGVRDLAQHGFEYRMRLFTALG